jgi:hypothetical protein
VRQNTLVNYAVVSASRRVDEPELFPYADGLPPLMYPAEISTAAIMKLLVCKR